MCGISFIDLVESVARGSCHLHESTAMQGHPALGCHCVNPPLFWINTDPPTAGYDVVLYRTRTLNTARRITFLQKDVIKGLAFSYLCYRYLRDFPNIYLTM